MTIYTTPDADAYTDVRANAFDPDNLTKATRERLQPRGDPTRTKTLRGRLEQEFNGRWRTVRGDIRAAVADNDAFGLRESATPTSGWEHGPTPNRPSSLAGPNASSTERARAFETWVEQTMYDRLIDRSPGTPLRDWWAAPYVREAYVRGVGLANADARAAGYDLADETVSITTRDHREAVADHIAALDSDIRGAIDAVALGAYRTFSGETGFANASLVRTLTDRLTGLVSATGQTRTATAAATRVVETVNTAVINQAQRVRARVLGTTPETMWNTAGDQRVCSQCADIEGESWRVGSDDITKPPLHPRCRCRLIIVS